MKVMKKPVVLDAFNWPGGVPVDMPDWLGRRAHHVAGSNTLRLDNGVNRGPTIAGPGDTIVRGEHGELLAIGEHAIEAQWEVLPEVEPEPEPKKE